MILLITRPPSLLFAAAGQAPGTLAVAVAGASTSATAAHGCQDDGHQDQEEDFGCASHGYDSSGLRLFLIYSKDWKGFLVCCPFRAFRKIE